MFIIEQNSKQTDYTFSDIDLVCSIENVFINNILKHGVTVTLQILVLSFWVRIPVLHQRFGCKLVRMVGPQQRLKKTRVPGKDRQVSLIKKITCTNTPILDLANPYN